MLKWIYYIRPEDPSKDCVKREDPVNATFIAIVRNMLRKELASLMFVDSSSLQGRMVRESFTFTCLLPSTLICWGLQNIRG